MSLNNDEFKLSNKVDQSTPFPLPCKNEVEPNDDNNNSTRQKQTTTDQNRPTRLKMTITDQNRLKLTKQTKIYIK